MSQLARGSSLLLMFVVFLSGLTPRLTAQSDHYGNDRSFIEGNEYKEGFRREMYVQFRPDSPIKGCRSNAGSS